MEVKETLLKGCYILKPRVIEDLRGRFVKPWNIDDLNRCGLYFQVNEEYYTVSKKNVLRGLHFQTPPKAARKIVICLSGKIFDVVVDLRKNSPTYKQYFSTELSPDEGKMIYISEGLAHGFCVLSDEATLLYLCSEVYSSENDSGIRWNSTGIVWPIYDPILSERDSHFATLDELDNPF